MCEERRWVVELGKEGVGWGWGVVIHSVTLQPSTLQSRAGPGRGRPGHRRLQTRCHTGREIYSPSEPAQMTLLYPNTHSALLLILLRRGRLWKVINDNTKH